MQTATPNAQSQTSTLTLTISEVVAFIEEQVDFFARTGQEIPDHVYMSNDVIKALIINNQRMIPDSMYEGSAGHQQLNFITSHGQLTVKRIFDKENYIAVGGVDYVTMVAEEELLSE